eukprot:1635122-Alexandrium_andersonii.AAC.1
MARSGLVCFLWMVYALAYVSGNSMTQCRNGSSCALAPGKADLESCLWPAVWATPDEGPQG